MDRHTAALPGSLPAWIPYLWSRVLFPGRSPARIESVRLLSVALLLILPAMLLYPCLAFRLLEPDEGRYAEIPREMNARGDWVVPYLQGQPYLDKPPLVYWLVMLSYRVCGVHDWAARLIPALAIHGCVLLTYFFGCRLLRERAAFWGALLLGLAPGFLSMGRLLLLDGVLTFWTTLALFAAFEALRGERLRWGWWCIAAAACGLGILTKGPVALVLVAAPLLLYRWLTGRCWPLCRRDVFVFLGIVLAIALPWYVALGLRIPGFARYFLWEHNLERFLMPFAHEQGVWYYGPILLSGLLPGSLLFMPLARFLFSSKPGAVRRRTAELGFLLLAGGWCLFFFTLSTCKLPTYILPAYPPLCLALGYVLVSGSWRLSRTPALVAVTAYVLLLGTHLILVPWYAAYRSPMCRAEDVRRYCADRSIPVVCYPRDCDSVSFYLHRDDLRSYRSKEIEDLRALVRVNPRTVILCTHRHSLKGLKELLPPEVCVVESVHCGLSDMPNVPGSVMKPLAKLMGETALGLCDVAVIGPRPRGAEQAEPPGRGQKGLLELMEIDD
jgi:4-amino-4-deoxy-L-arabinose transferase-like glycosyltransferase